MDGMARDKKQGKRHLGITIVAVLMILFGIAEIATGFTGNFAGVLSITTTTVSVYGAFIVGALYAIGGLLLFPMKKKQAKASLVCLLFVVIGRGVLVATGAYPLSSTLQTASIVIGTAIAIVFMVYIKLKWNSFK